MFRVLGNSACHCDGLTRRGFLQTGVLGLGGLTLPDLLRIRAQAAKPIRDTAVILFWLSGGPGHMETWDPKPGATTEYRGPLGAIRTAVPGIQFGDLFPGQARLMDKLAVVRTVNHGSGDHTKSNHWMLTGHEGPAFNAPDFKQQRRPSLGAVAARLRGPNKPGMPAYAAVPPSVAVPTTSFTTRPTSAAGPIRSSPNRTRTRRNSASRTCRCRTTWISAAWKAAGRC